MSRGKTVTGVAAVALGLAAVGGIATAANTKVKITPVHRSYKSAVHLGKVMAVNPSQVIGARFVHVPPLHTPVAVGRAPHGAFAGFPRSGATFAMLSTGCTTLASHANTSPSTSCKDGGRQVSGTRDTTILGVKLQVPKTAKCLSFRFRFLSEEYPEFVGSQYNDAFIAELDKSTWHSIQNRKIYAPRNFAKTADGTPIRINATGVARVSRANAKGTTYDAGTRVLRASTPIKPGKHFLYLSIFDQGDRQYDSTVLIDQLTLNRRSPCKSGLAKG